MSYRSQQEKDVRFAIKWVLVSVIAMVALAFALTWASFGINVATAGLVGRGKAHIQIQSAESRIANYEHFFNLCAAVQTDEASIDAQTQVLATAKDEDDRSRINQNLGALQANRARSIYQYNVDAAKDYTSGQFRDSQLPYELSAEPYIAGGEHTQCT